ncbi:putative P-loop containing nucleoside triphosphate hydrolase, leucine-rich repeat domain superfamily [Helianthus debilis subsp. tardiflorus]
MASYFSSLMLAAREAMEEETNAYRRHHSYSGSIDSGNIHDDVLHESNGIEEIADDVSDNLLSLSLNVDEDLIGIKIPLQELRSHLEIGKGGVRMIGIWGMGGAGKTTLASSIYDEISGMFDGCCFVDNIREKSSKYGFEILQEKLLSDILKQKGMKVERVAKGKQMIKSNLCNRNVLIVLDDVDHPDQLKMLVGSHDWFGEGSRIIITTRDEHVLNAHKVNVIYKIRLLHDDEALELFCKHAPQQDYIPKEEYEMLSKEVICYAGGLPLALKVLGSFLCDKDINQWRSALARLKDIPEEDILGKLKISYDGLKPMEKELFLDIACFYRGVSMEEAMVSLDACGFHPRIGIKVLRQKALITVSNDKINMRHTEGMFDMHDLVQEMGHYIAQGEHRVNPEKHSRIWREKDILSICSMYTTMNSDKIEALYLYFYNYEMNCPPDLPQVVATMKNLRSIYCWSFPRQLLQANFQPAMLCCLILQHSKQEQLWTGRKHLPNLKVLDLSSSFFLIETPDLGGLPRLERMILQRCSRLKEIHPSTGYQGSLVFLDLHGCSNLEMFPKITHMPKLMTLILSACSRLLNFPDIQKNLDSLVDISLRYSRMIEVLPSSIVQYCTNLISLDLSDCFNLKSIEFDFRDFKKIEKLHLSNLRLQKMDQLFVNSNFLPPFLTSLSLRSIPILFWANIPSDIICELSNLQVLDLSENGFSRIPLNLVQLPRLKFLDISSCINLVELPDLPPSIAVLDADRCDSLVIKDFPTTYKWLWKVTLGDKVRGGENVLQSVFQENTIEDHFMGFHRHNIDISRALGFDISTRSFAYETFTLQLPLNWYSDYSGFLVLFSLMEIRDVIITIKQEMQMDYQSRLLEESEHTKSHIVNAETLHIKRMCYIPFSSLMHKSLWNGNISFFVSGWCVFKVELVPRRSKGGSPERSRNCSEYWDGQIKDRKTFTIKDASQSSIEITWLH